MPDIIIYQCFCSRSIGLNTSRERNTPKLNLENIWVIFPNFPTRKYAEIYQGANIPQGSLRSRKTVHLSEQIMSADNHPCIVSCQMEVIDYIYPWVLSSWVKSDGSALKFVYWSCTACFFVQTFILYFYSIVDLTQKTTFCWQHVSDLKHPYLVLIYFRLGLSWK